jgi:uncharacterized surface protein with fasciclin (FAS1) repeats
LSPASGIRPIRTAGAVPDIAAHGEPAGPPSFKEMTMMKRTGLIALVAAAAMTAQAKAADIVETAASAGNFTTLLAAVEAAGLADTLKGEGPFTVFAPTDAAFEKLPQGTVENLLKPENRDQLQQILTYHVVPGRIMSSDLAGQSTTAKTVEGSDLEIDASGSGVMVESATVTQADIAAENGVIHVIDSVMMPQS